jgi:hypothetical protein
MEKRVTEREREDFVEAMSDFTGLDRGVIRRVFWHAGAIVVDGIRVATAIMWDARSQYVRDMTGEDPGEEG